MGATKQTVEANDGEAWEPVKVQLRLDGVLVSDALECDPQVPLSAPPAKIELPVKLTRLEAQIRMTQDEQDEDDSGTPLLRMMGALPPGLPRVQPSLGSALHADGTCRPCAWYWKPKSCLNAQRCSYCHLCADGELKLRKKSKVAMMRLGVVTPNSTPTGGATLDGFPGLERGGNVLNLASLL